MNSVVFARIKTHLSFIILNVSLLILLAAGVFLYQWINHLSQLDRQNDQENLVTGMVNLERGFSAELAEMAVSFRPIPKIRAGNSWGTYLFESYSQWRTTTRWPGLIHSVSIAVRSQDGKISFETFAPATGDFSPHDWPASLMRFERLLKNGASSHTLRLPFLRRGFVSLLVEGRPALAVPLFSPLAGKKTDSTAIIREPPDQAQRLLAPPPPVGLPLGPGPPDWPRSQFVRTDNFQLTGWCFLQLDPGYLRSHLLPVLVQQYFGASGHAKYHVAIVTGHPPQIIYASDPSLTPEIFSVYDAKVTLFAPRLHFGLLHPDPGALSRGQGLRSRLYMMGGHGQPSPPPRPRLQWSQVANANPQAADRPLLFVARARQWGQMASANPQAWQLVARDKSGSLDAEVNAVRRRNLAIAFGTLFLLGMSIGMLVIAAHRANLLAHRQMEFVAGISHELRTPLTVIESAAHNLAQGLVDDAGRVQQYGQAIQTEGRRLSNLIQQTLGYAALQSGRQHYEFSRVSVTEVLDRAWAVFAAAFEEGGWVVEKDVSHDIPPVNADPQVLESAIENLLSNALKYASRGKWLRITARTARRWRVKEVIISVEDRGPGIDVGDLPHIFEPFYRGRKVVASSTSGAGLGLSLVSEHLLAHQGHVAAQNLKPRGVKFILYLPCSG